jgi:hypothetical protein
MMSCRGWPRLAALALFGCALLAVGTGWCLPGLGLAARLLALAAPGWAAPSWYSVVVLATAREGADVSSTVERLLAAGVRPPQILLLNAADPPQQLADFYRTFLLQPGVRALAPAARLRAPRGVGAAASTGDQRRRRRRQQQLAECTAVASAARQVLGGATWGRWDADWIVMLADDSSLRLRPGAGRELGAALRGYGGCSHGVVTLEGLAPGTADGYAFHRRVLGRVERAAAAMCAAWTDEPQLASAASSSAAAAPPTVELVLQRVVEDLSRADAGVAEPVRGLTYRADAPAATSDGMGTGTRTGTGTGAVAGGLPSLRCPATAQEMRIMVAVPTFNRPRYVNYASSSVVETSPPPATATGQAAWFHIHSAQDPPPLPYVQHRSPRTVKLRCAHMAADCSCDIVCVNVL